NRHQNERRARRAFPPQIGALRSAGSSCIRSSTSWSHHLKSRDHEPVTALRIVTELSDCISRRQALDTPLFGNNIPSAGHDEQFGGERHSRCSIATTHSRKPNSPLIVLQIRRSQQNANI